MYTCDWLFIANNKIYGCVIQRKDHLINKETGEYDEAEYTKHPNRYTSTFKSQVRISNKDGSYFQKWMNFILEY